MAGGCCRVAGRSSRVARVTGLKGSVQVTGLKGSAQVTGLTGSPVQFTGAGGCCSAPGGRVV